MFIALLSLIAGCSKKTTPEEPAPAPVTPAPVAPGPETAPAVALPTTPQGFYETCKERVEGPGEAGECASDSDCLATGCSKEMCVSAAMAEGMMSPCEIAPCFQVLDTCTCQETQCSWALKAELPSELQTLVEQVNAPR